MEKKTDVLVVGNGSREHTICWKLRQSPSLGSLYVAPGNAGTAEIAQNVPISNLDLITQFAKEKEIDLVVVGPEAPLADGIVDQLAEFRVNAVGPNQKAAQLESSKIWSNSFFERHSIPHANSLAFDKISEALNYMSQVDPASVVIKADGLCGGKGVFLHNDREDANLQIFNLMEVGALGDAGRRILISERLIGPEVSLNGFTDGRDFIILPYARDHKRVGDYDTGPNTGGMGAFAPCDVNSKTHLEMLKIVDKMMYGLSQEGIDYKGAFFPGFILTKDGPMLIEVNIRLGDPETQVILPLLEEDLLEVYKSIVNGNLNEVPKQFSTKAAVGVVLASPGYPGLSLTNRRIHIPKDLDQSILVFHAGTNRDEEGQLVTAGGRVLTIVNVANSQETARNSVYNAIGPNGIYFEGMQYRTDIGLVA